MGRRGHGERGLPLVSGDVLPALKADGVLAPLRKWPDFPANKVVPQDFVFPVLVPREGNEDFFVFRR